jgi:hypothetical protein
VAAGAASCSAKLAAVSATRCLIPFDSMLLRLSLLHSICTTVHCMKTAQLPPVRVEASVREEIEAVLREGESLSEFVETAAVQAARRRKAQEEFLARGRASLAKAKRTGEFYVADKVLEDMRGRLLSRMQALRKGKSKSTAGAKR